MSCCHGIMTENDIKNGQMNVRIVKSPGRDGQNSFIPRYLRPCPKHFFYMKFSGDL